MMMMMMMMMMKKKKKKKKKKKNIVHLYAEGSFKAVANDHHYVADETLRAAQYH